MGNSKSRNANAPKRKGGGKPIVPAPVTDFNKTTPKFCLAHVIPDFNLEHLSTEQQASVAQSIYKRCQLTWNQIIQDGRHGLGFELIPFKQMSCAVPEVFKDQDRAMVFRYHDKLPMAGVRVADTFHVLCFERQYGELYDHG